MATVNFSVPDETKARFDRTFAGKNKSAIVARLLEEAIERELLRRQRAIAVNKLLALREETRPLSATQIRKARIAGRP